MSFGPPAPSLCPPERLWRILTRRPRPRLPLQWRASAAPGTALYAVALRGGEQEDAADETGRDGPADVVRSRLHAALTVRALWTSAGPAFATVEQLGALPGDEAAALSQALFRALSICSPTFTWSDWQAWETVLRKGAEHPSNLSEALAAGACCDFGPFGGSAPRPDRYFGLPVADLTDGQTMAFRAARALYLDVQKRNQ